MPFHALLRDGISDFWGMDSHSGEFYNGENRKAVAPCTGQFADEDRQEETSFSKPEKLI